MCCAVSIAALPAGVRRGRPHKHLAAPAFERKSFLKEASEKASKWWNGEEKVVTTLDEADLLKRGKAILAAKAKREHRHDLTKFFGKSGALFLRHFFSNDDGAHSSEHKLFYEHFLDMTGMPGGLMTALTEESDARRFYNEEFQIEAKESGKDGMEMFEAMEKGDISDVLKEAKADADAAFKKWKHALAPWLGSRKNDGTLAEFQDALCALDLGGYKKGEYGCKD